MESLAQLLCVPRKSPLSIYSRTPGGSGALCFIHLLAIFIGFLGLFSSGSALAKVVHYELRATQGVVNLSGKKQVDWALMINGSIPAPTLEFTEGDEAEIVVKNMLHEEMSIHWHGILLPPEQDGVSYVNTPPILAGQSHIFRFKIRQHGTYWYHSHTKFQEQKGIYGAIIIHPKNKKIAYDRDLVVVLSDWSDENADQIMKNLRKDGDYYLYKKNSMRSWFGAIKSGRLGNFLGSEWTGMGGMDVSDVGYDAFLINGKRESQLLEGSPGQKVRIRIINAAASSYFYVSLGQESMEVISADGIDIKPVLAKEILVGMAETYDLLYEIPEAKNLELRATSQDITGFASGWIGVGEKVQAIEKVPLDLYESMDHSTHAGAHHGHAMSVGDHENHAMPAEHSDPHSNHKHESPAPILDTLTVDQLKSESSTKLSENAVKYEVKLVLGGDMERYIWHINGRAIHQDRTIEIREGEVVRFSFINETMMHHPMHLHGHFFRVLNNNGDFSPLKHTVDVPPHQTRTIEFLANEPGEWMLHCHNLYHMKTGMARVVKYSSFKPKSEIEHYKAHDPHLHDHLYANGIIKLATNHASLGLRLLQTWDSFEFTAETHKYRDLGKNVESELIYRRWISNYLSLAFGVARTPSFTRVPYRVLAGFSYLLPMLIESEIFVDHKGNLRLAFEKHFQWTSSLFSDVDLSFQHSLRPEFGATFMYGPAWEWAVGVMANGGNIGIGAQYRF